MSIINYNYYKNNNKRSDEEYEAFYIANNYDRIREIKLFSFKNNKILTVCTSADEAKKQLEQYETLAKNYNMPRVQKCSKYENALEIMMVDLREFAGEKLALENICVSTISNNPDINTLKSVLSKDLIGFSYDDEINLYLQKIVDMISPEIFDLTIPICIQHGDLSKENLIYGECEEKTDFWWIDWEHVKERAFFYDYFFYILNSSFYYNMNSYKCYINGESDEFLKKMFNHFEIPFDIEKKFDYLLLFTIPFLKERVCSKGGLPILIEYYKLIESMRFYAKGEKINNEA